MKRLKVSIVLVFIGLMSLIYGCGGSGSGESDGPTWQTSKSAVDNEVSEYAGTYTESYGTNWYFKFICSSDGTALYYYQKPMWYGLYIQAGFGRIDSTGNLSMQYVGFGNDGHNVDSGNPTGNISGDTVTIDGGDFTNVPRNPDKSDILHFAGAYRGTIEEDGESSPAELIIGVGTDGTVISLAKSDEGFAAMTGTVAQAGNIDCDGYYIDSSTMIEYGTVSIWGELNETSGDGEWDSEQIY